MNTDFSYTNASAPAAIIFDTIYGEVSGGALVANPDHDLRAGVAVGRHTDGKLYPIKGYRLVKAVASADTTIEIAKGSGVLIGDIIATAKKGVAVTAVDTTTYTTKDVVTVTLGVDIAIGKVLYQAAAASASAAVPIYTPFGILGDDCKAGEGDRRKKVVLGAIVRKETILASDEVIALLPTIQKA